MMTLDWQEYGACVGTDVALWDQMADCPESVFPNIQKELAAVCAACPVQQECLNWALNHEAWGLWGGLTAKERKTLRRDLGITLRDVA